MDVTRRRLLFGAHQLESVTAEPGAAPTMIAGTRLYVLGYGSGVIAPIGLEHLIGLMGGIWCHPARVGDGLWLDLLADDGTPLPAGATTLNEGPQGLRWEWAAGELAVSRSDRALPDEPAYTMQIGLHNTGDIAARGSLRLQLRLCFDGAWMGGIRTGNASYHQQGQLLVGQDGIQHGWGIAFGCAEIPVEIEIAPQGEQTLATLHYNVSLAAKAEQHWSFLLVVEHERGAVGASERWEEIAAGSGQRADFGSADRSTQLQLASDDLALNRDMALAVANLALLNVDYPQLGRYFLAGLPEYPQLFGCDTTYSVPGALAAGFVETTRDSLLTLGRYADRACGRVPHELTTNGRIFHPGNVQETPQFTIAVWDYLRWTGDLATARTLFSVCHDGMTELMPALCGPDGLYPYGDGIVERMGMGARKLDSACYYIAGLRALADLAESLQMSDAESYRVRADYIHDAFERDWWLEDEGLYADSLHMDGRPQLDRHWTAVLPLQLGLASPARAARVMQRIEEEFINEWGLMHTVDDDDRVWTLPTGLLALAAFMGGRAEQGLALATNIALTAQYGTLGTFKELIPEGLCYVQLWSAALYVQVIVEGLLGIQPDAPGHMVALRPCLPDDFVPLQLQELRIGAHRLNLTITAQQLQVEHLNGPQALKVIYGQSTHMIEVGSSHVL